VSFSRPLTYLHLLILGSDWTASVSELTGASNCARRFTVVGFGDLEHLHQALSPGRIPPRQNDSTGIDRRSKTNKIDVANQCGTGHVHGSFGLKEDYSCKARHFPSD
jgi:hypothetical protein